MAIVQVVQDTFMSTSRFTLVATISATGLVLYWLVLAVYRLYLSPLAKIPGPKLAALTQWTEAYYELFHEGGGRFLFQYRKWHEQYGPIVRISPHEVHFQDSEFFESLYSASRKLNKLESLQYRFNNPLSAFSTPLHNTHRMRRAALNPFFSTRKISQHVPVIQARVNKLCDRLAREYSGTSQILVLDDMWGCLTSDTIVEYCFDRTYNFLDEPNFRALFVVAITDLVDGVHLMTQFPWVLSILNHLPDSVVKWLQPAMASVIDFNHEMRNQISAVLKSSNGLTEEKPSESVFNALLRSDLPPEELSLDRLQHEAVSLIGAGLETTRRALSVACFHILNNPPVLNRLRQELIAAIPHPETPPPLETLEKLPYLSACIQEALRLSYGTSQRAPRTSDNPITYNNHTLPPGTVVSMTHISIAHDEAIFPSSFHFKPERWLGSPRAPSGKYLSRYMVSFGHGTRSCLGMTLAYAEMYVALATVVRRFEMELFETGREAVDCYRDMFAPQPRPGTRGVRVLVRGTVD